MFGRAPHPSGDWLEVPTGRLWPYVKMLPRLEAERSLSQITEMAAGFGSMEKDEHHRFVQQLRHAARGAGAQRERTSAAALIGMGISVETVERTEGGEDISPSNSDTPSSS